MTRQRAPSTSGSGSGSRGMPVEVRRPADVGRARRPVVEVALGDRQRPPALVAGEDVGVRACGTCPPSTRRRDRRRRSPPCVGQRSRRKTSFAVRVLAERLGRRGRRPSGRRARRRPRAAARRGSSPSPPGGCAPRSCGCPRARQQTTRSPSSTAAEIGSGSGPGVPDAGRAAVADGVEAELARGTASGRPCRSSR